VLGQRRLGLGAQVRFQERGLCPPNLARSPGDRLGRQRAGGGQLLAVAAHRAQTDAEDPGGLVRIDPRGERVHQMGA
jgi:hypothetical protein